jgi:hypothetical protein
MVTFPRNADGVDFSGSPMVQCQRGVYPDWWCFVPVAGKATYLREWAEKPLPREKLLGEYKSKVAYRGLGVVTGEFSGGLIAIDIDGPDADERYKAVAGDAYEAHGEESTMSWTSGKPGRRQILYRVPQALLPEMRDIKTVILRLDGTWHLGNGDMARAAGVTPDPAALGEGAYQKPDYQEVVLRFNKCQSVVPGSPHPDTKKPYQWLNYHHGKVELAPQWMLDVLRSFRQPVRWLSEDDLKALDGELGETLVPERQIRGWFFKEEVQNLLRPRLEDLVFSHLTFDSYGWRTREGSNPQRMSGCPWHGGNSGTAFQYSTESGCWDCKACAVGGDVLDFIHKVRKNDPHAPRPRGAALETYVAEIASGLGLEYPACAQVQEVINKEAPLTRMTGPVFFKLAQRTIEEIENPEVCHFKLLELARDAGLGHVYRSGPQIEAAVERYLISERQHKDDPDWQKNARGNRAYLIPDFMSRPSSILFHARGGLGKTRIAVLLSRIIGRQETLKIRGLNVKPTTSGNVLFIGTDMSETDYAEYLDQQGIDTSGADKWFVFKPYWQQSQYRLLVKWLQEHKPALVVIDSLTSVSTAVAAKEYEKEYANTLYRIARENGVEYPATTFLIVHHNTKDGSKFRGTDALRNAVHETWELQELSDEERREYGSRSLILKIEKCRGQRSGDRFLIQEDIEEVLSLEDLTPTVAREDNGLGDETPRTIVLDLLKQAEVPLSVKDLRYALNARLEGQRALGKLVSERTVRRWVTAWKTAGLVEDAGTRQAGPKGGKPEPLFQCVALKYLGQDVRNLPDFFQTPSAGREVVTDTVLAITPEADLSETPEAHESVVSPETLETQELPEDGVTEVEVSGPEPEASVVTDTGVPQGGVSVTSEDETQSEQAISGNEVSVTDTRGVIFRDPPQAPPAPTPEDDHLGHPKAAPAPSADDPSVPLWLRLIRQGGEHWDINDFRLN